MLVGPERSKAVGLGGKVSNTQTQVADAQQLLAGSNGQEEPGRPAPARGRHACSRCRCPGILRQLTGIAKTTQVELDAVTPQAPTPVGARRERKRCR